MSYSEKSQELLQLHQTIKFEYGSLAEEFPEQVMSMMFLSGKEKVLELGGNVGRNSMIIASILNRNNNYDYVTFETNPDDANRLKHNRDLNGLKFHVESAALSNRKLIQSHWTSVPSDEVLSGYMEVATMTWKQLNEKYNIQFDTLVLDCEGAFYYILKDTPEILDNINLILMENDYFTYPIHKDEVFDTLRNRNFVCVFQMALDHDHPDFYQVWKKIAS